MKRRLIVSIVLFICFSGVMFPQKAGKKISISGTVTDAAGKPVAGAMIFVDKNKTDKVTNSSGTYRIRVKPAAKLISVLSLANGLSDKPIDGQTTINFRLPGSPLGNIGNEKFPVKNDEVNIGYGTIERKNATMHMSTLEGRQKAYVPYQNIFEMIRGQVPGVEVNGKSIRIAGSDSFMLSTEPLYVVDGMTVETIDGLNPAEVKSIVVLKGPSASIYGSRGANGVIVITLISGEDR